MKMFSIIQLTVIFNILLNKITGILIFDGLIVKNMFIDRNLEFNL